LSVHPQVYINAKRREGKYTREDWVESSTKLEAIKDIIEEDLVPREDGLPHKYIIFCQFTDEMTIIKEYLINEIIVEPENILMYNGSVDKEGRDKILAHSKASTDKKLVLLIQLHAGGVGLNLQEYDRVIFTSPWWTSAVMDQAIARAVRMGQKEVVHVYHLALAVENESIINIDWRIKWKADEKRKQLEKLFELAINDI
jgi:SNF2 family DNA or RNA helicase